VGIAVGCLLLIALLIVAVLCSPPEWLLRRTALAPSHVRFRFPVSQRLLAVTIDDGPHAATTSRILDVLREQQVAATFFPWTATAAAHPDLLRRMVTEGHELGNHLDNDHVCWDLPLEEFSTALRESDRVLRNFGGPVRWFRPPGALATSAQYREIVGWGYLPVLGNVYPYDARLPSVNFALAFVLWNVRPGAVIVLHDGPGRGDRTVRLLQRLLPALKRRGYLFATLTTLAGNATKTETATEFENA